MDVYKKVIPHSEQRYPTCGDWWLDENDDLQIRVSKLGNPLFEALVSQHEEDEALLCIHKGINEKDVTAFDTAFEAARKPGDMSEPGDDPAAPYFHEHFFATTLERLRAQAYDIDWNEYEEAINAL